MLYFSTLIISFFITIALTPIFKRAAVRIHAMDIPDDRKVHTQPIPKCGGIAMAFGALIPVFFLTSGNQQISSILIGAVIIVIFGVLDDIKDFDYRIKFSVQIIAALTVILLGDVSIKSLGMLVPEDLVLPDYVAVPLTLFVIVGVTNAINLADGLDGLAGGISILSFGLIGFLAFRSGDYIITMISFSMIGAIFGFLRFNTYPARLFMGDAGSQLLGFLAVTLSLAVTQGNSPYNVLVPLMIVGVPVLDTIRVMVQRILARRPVFAPDRNHLHHRLIDFGFYQTEAVFLFYILQTVMIVSGYLFRYYSEWILLLLYLFFSGAILYFLMIAETQGWRLNREGFINLNAIKKRLRFAFREAHITIKISMGMLKIWVPAAFIVLCLLPHEMPAYGYIFLIACAACLVISLPFKSRRLERNIIRLVLYMTTPFVLYFSDISSTDFYPLFLKIYDAFLLAILIPAVVVLRFTRRRDGFVLKPMDYLIFLIALGIAVMPGIEDISIYMRLLVTKMMVLFFSYEVLIGELRGKTKWLGWVTAGSLLVLVVKGMVS